MIKSVLMVKVLSVQIVSSRLLLSNLNKCGVVTFENNAICLVDQHGRLSAQIALPVFFLCNFGLEHYISITLHLYSRPLNKLDNFFFAKNNFLARCRWSKSACFNIELHLHFIFLWINFQDKFFTPRHENLNSDRTSELINLIWSSPMHWD